MDADLGTLVDAVVEPNPLACWRLVADKPSDRRQKVARRVLGIDARLDRPAVEPHVVLGERQLLAGGDAQHQLDEIEPGDQLGHRMLDLQPRIHFEKVEIALAIDDELDRAGRAVIDGASQRHRLRAHCRAGHIVEERARRLLDDLLMPALDRAFALAEIDDVAVRVAQHLDFDMPRLLDVLFDKDAVVGKARPSLAGRRAEPVARLLVRGCDAHALAAAAGRSLEHDRVADIAGDRDRGFSIGNDLEISRHGRNARRLGRAFWIRSCRPSPRSLWVQGR